MNISGYAWYWCRGNSMDIDGLKVYIQILKKLY